MLAMTATVVNPHANIFKKKAACLLRSFAKGKRNNGKGGVMPYSRAVIAVAGISNLEKANIFLPRSFREAPM